MYQKGHVEFFVSPASFEGLLPKLQVRAAVQATASQHVIAWQLVSGGQGWVW